MLCASSRHGLKQVKEGLAISADEMESNLYVFNPDKEAGNKLFDQLVSCR